MSDIDEKKVELKAPKGKTRVMFIDLKNGQNRVLVNDYDSLEAAMSVAVVGKEYARKHNENKSFYVYDDQGHSIPVEGKVRTT